MVFGDSAVTMRFQHTHLLDPEGLAIDVNETVKFQITLV